MKGVHLDATVDVDAPAERLWAVVADPVSWPAWTASMDDVDLLDGGLQVGAAARVSQPRMRPLVWTVTELQPGRTFAWEATTGGVRTIASHEVVPLGTDGSRLRLTLVQQGPAAWLARALLGRRTRRFVEMELHGLKAAAEAGRHN